MQQRPVWMPETRDFIALMLVGALIGLLFTMVLRPVSIPDNAVTNLLIGGFMTVVTGIAQFYFGSSKGSASKDDTINAIATAQAESPVAKSATPVAPASVFTKAG